MEGQCKELKHTIGKIIWFMRGSVTLTEAYEMGPEDREILTKIINDNLETTKKTKMPFF
tara:strand:+ start:3994 stop:4170 length:177 start_codon:yes stop_codon:yes gene_type:complete